MLSGFLTVWSEGKEPILDKHGSGKNHTGVNCLTSLRKQKTGTMVTNWVKLKNQSRC